MKHRNAAFNVDFKDRLKKRRKVLKLSQSQVAEKAGVKQQAIQRIEVGKVLSTTYVLEIADALDVCPYWLLFGDKIRCRCCNGEINASRKNNVSEKE